MHLSSYRKPQQTWQCRKQNRLKLFRGQYKVYFLAASHRYFFLTPIINVFRRSCWAKDVEPYISGRILCNQLGLVKIVSYTVAV